MGAALAVSQTCGGGCGTGCQKRGGDVADGLWNVVALRYPEADATQVVPPTPQSHTLALAKTYAWAAFQDGRSEARPSSVVPSAMSGSEAGPSMDVEKAPRAQPLPNESANSRALARGLGAPPLEGTARPDAGASPTPPRVPWAGPPRASALRNDAAGHDSVPSLCRIAASRVHCSSDFAGQDSDDCTEICVGPPDGNSTPTEASDAARKFEELSSVAAMVDLDIPSSSPPQSPDTYASAVALRLSDGAPAERGAEPALEERELAANLPAEVAKLRRELTRNGFVTTRDVDVGWQPLSEVSSLSSVGTAQRVRLWCCRCCRRRREIWPMQC